MSAFSEKERQVFVEAYTDGMRYAESVAKVNLARLLARFTQSPPCDFECMDEKSINDEWCEDNCGEVSEERCWRHAIKEGWLDERI